MKTKLMNVPRGLIKFHSLHPEPYGESVVVLLNGMFTDVYTYPDGLLYTETNNKALIKYLNHHKQKDLVECFKIHDFTLRTVTQKDLSLMLNLFYKDEGEDFTEIARIFISHTITYYSHGYIIEDELNHPIGFYGYNIINNHLISHHKLLTQNKHFNTQDLETLIIKTIKKKYEEMRFRSN